MRSASLLDNCICFIPMLINTFPRILLLALLFALLPYDISIIIVIGILLISLLFAYKDIKEAPKPTLLALLLTIMASSLVVDSYSWLFLKTGSLVNTLYLFITWGVYYITTKPDILNTFGFNNISIQTSRTIFECLQHPDYNITMRCQYDASSHEFENCSERGFWKIPNDPSGTVVTVCNDQWKYYLRFTWLLTALLIIGYFGLYFLHIFLNPVTKMRVFKKLTCSNLILWKKNEMSWLPYLNELLDGSNDFQKINDNVKDDVGAPFLDLTVESRYHSFVKV